MFSEKLVWFDCRWSPAAEEAEDFLLAVALTFLEEAGVLGVDDFAVLVEHHKDGVAEARGIAQPLQHLGCLLHLGLALSLTRVVVHMDIDKVVVNDLADDRVFGHEVGKAQAPRTPVAANLAYHELSLSLGLDQRVVNLLKRIEAFVIDFLQRCLGKDIEN